MTDVIAQAWPLLAVVAFVLVIRWNMARVPRWGAVPDHAPFAPGDEVPVTQIHHRRTFGGTRNGINPQLWLTPSGIRFTIFGTNERRSSDFRQVHAAKAWFGRARLIFIGRGERIHVYLLNTGIARALLAALPGDVPLSPAAAALLGGRPRPPSAMAPAVSHHPASYRTDRTDGAPASGSVSDGLQRPALDPAPAALQAAAPRQPEVPVGPLSIALFAGFAAFTAWTVWGWITYAGVYRWLSDWQVSLLGDYVDLLSLFLPLVVVSGPLLFGAILTAEPGRRWRPFALIAGLVGLGALGLGTGLIVRALAMPSDDAPPMLLDLARLGEATPPKTKARLIGRVDKARVAVVPRHTVRTAYGDDYIPVLPVDSAGNPVRYVQESTRQRNDGVAFPYSDNPQGVLLPSRLPNEARARLEEKGVMLASDVHLLVGSTQRAYWSDIKCGMACLLCGVLLSLSLAEFLPGKRTVA